jgi:hypothetical protein
MICAHYRSDVYGNKKKKAWRYFGTAVFWHCSILAPWYFSTVEFWHHSKKALTKNIII